MIKKLLKGTELAVSPIALGTTSFSSPLDDGQSGKLMDDFIASGGNFFDTANCYGRWLSDGLPHCEMALGRLVKARNNRHDIIISSKGAHPIFNTMHIPRMSEKEVLFDLEDSLKNMQTEYIDLYFLHRDDPSKDVSEIMTMLNKFIKSGKIRYIGCSNWSAERISAANEFCAKENLQPFVVDQNLMNLAKVNPETLTGSFQTYSDEKTIELYNGGLTAMPYSSQAGGLFTKMCQADFMENNKYKHLRHSYLNDETLKRSERVNEFAEKNGYEPTQIALAWLINQSFTCIPIVGSNTPERLDDAVKATEIKFTKDEIIYLGGK